MKPTRVSVTPASIEISFGTKTEDDDYSTLWDEAVSREDC